MSVLKRAPNTFMGAMQRDQKALFKEALFTEKVSSSDNKDIASNLKDYTLDESLDKVGLKMQQWLEELGFKTIRYKRNNIGDIYYLQL